MSKDSPKFFIGASSAPDHQDCPRRWAGNHIKGFLPPRTTDGGAAPQGIGALIGDCCHKAAQNMLAQKAEIGSWDLEAAIEIAFELLSIGMRGNIKTDKLTSGIGDARVQIRSMVTEFSRAFMPDAQPRFIEMAMRATIAPGKILSGHVDLIEESEPGVWDIYDHKFGGKLSPYHSQMGLYLVLLLSQKWFDGRVDRLILNHVARPGLKKKGGWKQAPLVQVSYDIFACEAAGRKQVKEIIKEREEYLETGNPWAFNANPRSSLCSEKYCRVWGTEACDQWTDLNGEDNEDDRE